jgi:uncharacterized protein YaeQ
LKYSFNIQSSDGAGEQTEKLVISAFDNEAGDSIALKLLAYLMFIKRRPRIDDDPGWQVVPDLIARDESGSINLWVDCGSVSVRKADIIATKGRDSIEFFVFRKTQRDLDVFFKQIADKMKNAKALRGVCFDDGFVDGIGQSLDRTNNLHAYVSEDMLTLTIDNSFGKHEAYSAVHRLSGEK